MTLPPRRIRLLLPAYPASGSDILPISQTDPNTGLPTTRGMTHAQFQADLLAAVTNDRAAIVAEFADRDTQILQSISDIQGHQNWIDSAISQLNALDATMTSTIAELESKVSHPAQWADIDGKPSTFPPSAHATAWADITGKPSTYPAVATAWADVTGKPSTFAPSAHVHVKADITDFPTSWPWASLSGVPATFAPSAHLHAIADITGLSAALAAKIDAPAVIGNPNTRSPAYATAYQATDPTKPSFISAMIDAIYTVTVASTLADTVELRIGNNQSQVANGTGGVVVAVFRTSLTGIALVIGLGLGQRNQLTAMLPAGWWWSLRRTQGTTATVTSATDQAIG